MFDNLLDWNPQFFREIKGRVKPKNIISASVVSIITQLLIVLAYLGDLPDNNSLITQYSHYCLGIIYDRHGVTRGVCDTNSAGEWIINWQLFWLDIFLCLSIISIFSLLVAGSYMLIADLTKEERKGTLNFIRLTPQSATDVLFGKILGVPIILYWVILLTLPLNFIAGLKAHIPLSLIGGFYTVMIASCAFFYSAAILLSLLNFAPAGFKPWLSSGAILVFLFVNNIIALAGDSFSNTAFDWLTIFYPGRVLAYLTDATSLYLRNGHGFYFDGLEDLLFYGQSWWVKPDIGMSLIIGNYLLWTYWLWRGLKRRFHSPTNTILSKEQSYWFTGWFVAVALGFTLQTNRYRYLFDNFILLQVLLLVMFLGLIAALSPHRQTLHDWARYRHQMGKDGNKLWKELIFGEKSPSTVAIAINLTIATVYILPSLFLFPFKDNLSSVLWGLLISANTILLYALIAQLILGTKSQKRTIWAATSILALIIAPFIGSALFGTNVEGYSLLWLFTFIPTETLRYTIPLSSIMVTVLGQWLAIALLSFQITRKLRQASASETKILFSSRG
ncbi:MAG: hypothetical protein AB4368_01965 [Xenococcaceae cyanobacterium]